MFRKVYEKIFGIRPKLSSQEMQRQAIISGMLHGIEEKKQTDPLIAPKVVSKEIVNKLINSLQTENGVHIESILCALGSLAGYSCQISLRAQAAQQGLPEYSVFDIIKTKDGKQYFFGNQLNELLVELPDSVWSLLAGAAQEIGCKNLPDITNIFKHAAQTVGEISFGIPQLPDEHKPHNLPIQYLITYWPSIFLLVKQFCHMPSEWPIAFSFAVQQVILMSDKVIDTKMAMLIVMESAIYMSKIDFGSI